MRQQVLSVNSTVPKPGREVQSQDDTVLTLTIDGMDQAQGGQGRGQTRLAAATKLKSS